MGVCDVVDGGIDWSALEMNQSLSVRLRVGGETGCAALFGGPAPVLAPPDEQGDGEEEEALDPPCRFNDLYHPDISDRFSWSLGWWGGSLLDRALPITSLTSS